MVIFLHLLVVVLHDIVDLSLLLLFRLGSRFKRRERLRHSRRRLLPRKELIDECGECDADADAMGDARGKRLAGA